MDFVTHAAVGALVGRGTTPRDAEPGTGGRLAAAGAIVASLPDADHVLEWIGAGAYLLHHRQGTHSLLFFALVVVAAALVPGPGRKRRAGLAAGAVGSHLFLDVLTPFGTGLLWPFADGRLALDVLPIVAPWMIGLSVLGLVYATSRAWRRGELAGRRAAWAAIGVLLAFIGVEGLVTMRAASLVAERGSCGAPAPHVSRGRGAPAEGGGGDPACVRADEVVALPHPNRPWEAVAFGADEDVVREYRVGITGHVEETRATPRLVSEDEDQREMARAAMARAAMHPYVSRFRLPAARVEGDRLVIQDVHYDHVTHDHEPAWIVFPLAAAGDDSAETASAHQLVLGVQPLAWGAVVLVAWGVSRRRWRAWRRSHRNDDEKTGA